MAKSSVKKIKFPLIFDYYDNHNEITEADQPLKLKCKQCTKTINGSVKVTLNFVSHLNSQHQTQYVEYKNNKEKKKKKKSERIEKKYEKFCIKTY